MKFDVTVNGRAAELSLESGRFEYNGLLEDYSLVSSGPGTYSVLIGNCSFEATVLAADTIEVDGRIFSVEIFDPRELRARSGGAESQGRQSVAAPMPGKVVRLLVAKGDAVDAGQGLIVVEAMKMQNEMKSPKAGTVVEIKTADGATVTAGEILVVIE